MIELNQLLLRLSKSEKVLRNSLNTIKSNKLQSLLPEITAWQFSIEVQHETIKQTLDYLVSLARYRSVNNLLTLNKNLASKSRNLLAIYRVAEAAKYNMQSYFIKAQKQHYSYKTLIENIALSTTLAKQDTYASWYRNGMN